jgi:hypothetical protein
MNDAAFFQSEVEFTKTEGPYVTRAGREGSVVLRLGRMSAAAAFMWFAPPASATEVVVIPSVVMRTHTSPELTPEVIALYREHAQADRDMANLDLESFVSGLAAEDE